MKTIVLYGASHKNDDWFLESFVNCTQIDIQGSVLAFLDSGGNHHETSRPWEVITKKEV